MHPSFVVARKELLQLSRDWMGLFACIVAPAFAMSILAGVVFGYLLRKPFVDASQAYRIGSSEADFAAYSTIAWDWFQESRYYKMERRDLERLAEKLQLGGAHVASEVPASGINSIDTFIIWCKSVSLSYRVNVKDMTGGTTMLVSNDPELKELFSVVVQGIGSFQHIEFTAPSKMSDAAKAIKDAIDSEQIDVFLRCREVAVRLGDGKVVYRLEMKTFADPDNERSENARAWISKLLTIRNDSIAKNMPDVAVVSEEGIDVGVDGNISKKDRQMLRHFATYVSFTLYMLTLKVAFGFAGEFALLERAKKTLEPLFLTHASRTSIALGKYLAVCVATMVATGFMIGCFWLILRLLIPNELFPSQTTWEAFRTISLFTLINAPIILSASGIALAVSFMSSNVKTAGALNGLALFAVLTPGFYLFMSGFRAPMLASFVPMLGTSLLVKGLIQGSFEWAFFAGAMASSLTLAVISLYLIVYLSNLETLLYGD